MKVDKVWIEGSAAELQVTTASESTHQTEVGYQTAWAKRKSAR